MGTAFEQAAARLQRVLQQENQALRAHDSKAVTELLPEKAAAADALAAAAAPQPAGSIAEPLRHALEENTRLLDLAIQVQSRIVSLVVRAARGVDRSAVGYSARGSETRASVPLALTTKA